MACRGVPVQQCRRRIPIHDGVLRSTFALLGLMWDPKRTVFDLHSEGHANSTQVIVTGSRNQENSAPVGRGVQPPP